ncbi:MAG: glutamine synthetase beta-grasp domain-containing protein, partial [Candidatus Omnitrophota bacterium]
MTKQDVLRIVKSKKVKFLRLWFTDVLGFLKSFDIPVEELSGAMRDGMGFDGSSIEGFSRIEESDMLVKPDPDTFQIIPWIKEDGPVARMFCDVVEPGGTPFEGDP